MKKLMGDSRVDGLPVRAGIYLRVSTQDQKEGHGMQMQKTKCEAMATVKEWSIAKIYEDEGISGMVNENERPGFSQLLKDAKAKEIDAVIVYALDRLGRRAQIVLRTIENLAEMGIKVASCRENFDTSTAVGKFVVTMFADLSELERNTIVERTKLGLEERRKIDGDIGGNVPMGYERKMGTVVINEEKAEVVRFIFKRRYIDFRYMYEIADELNEKGLPKPTKRGKVWKASVVQRILDNEAKYRGGFRNRSKFRWPRILPEDFDEQEAKANRIKDNDQLLNLPDPTGNPKFIKTQITGRNRKICRSKRAIEQLKALENGEIIPSPWSIDIPKKPKPFEEKIDIKTIPETSSSPIRKRISPKLNIPSPQNIRKKQQPDKESSILNIPSPKSSIPTTDKNKETDPKEKSSSLPKIPKLSSIINVESSPPRPPHLTRIRLQPKNSSKKSQIPIKRSI